MLKRKLGSHESDTTRKRYRLPGVTVMTLSSAVGVCGERPFPLMRVEDLQSSN